MEKNDIMRRAEELKSRVTALGVARVEVEYDGAGDSGDVQGVTAYGAAPRGSKDEYGEVVSLDGQSIVVNKLISEWNQETRNYERTPVSIEQKLEDALSDFACDFLSYLGIDWYNNEGGFGRIVLAIDGGLLAVRAEHNYRVESSEYVEMSL